MVKTMTNAIVGNKSRKTVVMLVLLLVAFAHALFEPSWGRTSPADLERSRAAMGGEQNGDCNFGSDTVEQECGGKGDADGKCDGTWGSVTGAANNDQVAEPQDHSSRHFSDSTNNSNQARTAMHVGGFDQQGHSGSLDAGGLPVVLSTFAAELEANSLKTLPQMQAAQANAAGQATAVADVAAEIGHNQAESAIQYSGSYMNNFTVEAGNRWNQIRDQIFVPIGILLLLPGAVLSQVKAIMAAGNPVLGQVNPFDGILRSLVAIFLLPATYLVVNYGIDIANSLSYTIASEYTRIVGGNMYVEAICHEIKAMPYRHPEENRNVIDLPYSSMGIPLMGHFTPFAMLEAELFAVKIFDPCAGIYLVPEDRANECVPSHVMAARAMANTTNAALVTSWNILCAFQLAYLYYLWCVGPVVAGLWVWPMKHFREALPNWIEGVITVCFWSFFWNTIVLLIAAFRGVDETGTIMMLALNTLANLSVKFAFDFAGLIRGAGAEAMRLGEKMAQAIEKSGGGGGGGGGGGEGGGCGEGGEGQAQGQQGAGPSSGEGSGGGAGGGGRAPTQLMYTNQIAESSNRMPLSNAGSKSPGNGAKLDGAETFQTSKEYSGPPLSGLQSAPLNSVNAIDHVVGAHSPSDSKPQYNTHNSRNGTIGFPALMIAASTKQATSGSRGDNSGLEATVPTASQSSEPSVDVLGSGDGMPPLEETQFATSNGVVNRFAAAKASADNQANPTIDQVRFNSHLTEKRPQLQKAAGQRLADQVFSEPSVAQPLSESASQSAVLPASHAVVSTASQNVELPASHSVAQHSRSMTPLSGVSSYPSSSSSSSSSSSLGTADHVADSSAVQLVSTGQSQSTYLQRSAGQAEPLQIATQPSLPSESDIRSNVASGTPHYVQQSDSSAVQSVSTGQSQSTYLQRSAGQAEPLQIATQPNPPSESNIRSNVASGTPHYVQQSDSSAVQTISPGQSQSTYLQRSIGQAEPLQIASQPDLPSEANVRNNVASAKPYLAQQSESLHLRDHIAPGAQEVSARPHQQTQVHKADDSVSPSNISHSSIKLKSGVNEIQYLARSSNEQAREIPATASTNTEPTSPQRAPAHSGSSYLARSERSDGATTGGDVDSLPTPESAFTADGPQKTGTTDGIRNNGYRFETSEFHLRPSTHEHSELTESVGRDSASALSRLFGNVMPIVSTIDEKTCAGSVSQPRSEIARLEPNQQVETKQLMRNEIPQLSSSTSPRLNSKSALNGPLASALLRKAADEEESAATNPIHTESLLLANVRRS